MFLAIGALLPDADTKQSFMGRIIPFWVIAKHRGWLHTIWAALFFTVVIGHFWNWDYGSALGIGYMIHLTMDSLTPNGRKKWKRRLKRLIGRK